MKPSVGRIVLYALTRQAADAINATTTACSAARSPVSRCRVSLA